MVWEERTGRFQAYPVVHMSRAAQRWEDSLFWCWRKITLEMWNWKFLGREVEIELGWGGTEGVEGKEGKRRRERE